MQIPKKLLATKKDPRRSHDQINHLSPTLLQAVVDLVHESFSVGVANLSEDEFSALNEAVSKIDTTIARIKEEICLRRESVKTPTEDKIISELYPPPAPPSAINDAPSNAIDIINTYKNSSTRKEIFHPLLECKANRRAEKENPSDLVVNDESKYDVKDSLSGSVNRIAGSSQHESNKVCASKMKIIENSTRNNRRLSFPLLSRQDDLVSLK